MCAGSLGLTKTSEKRKAKRNRNLNWKNRQIMQIFDNFLSEVSDPHDFTPEFRFLRPNGKRPISLFGIPRHKRSFAKPQKIFPNGCYPAEKFQKDRQYCWSGEENVQQILP